jgi:hypothetical protein
MFYIVGFRYVRNRLIMSFWTGACFGAFSQAQKYETKREASVGTCDLQGFENHYKYTWKVMRDSPNGLKDPDNEDSK